MPVITVEDIAYVRVQAPDLDLMERFLLDFGLHRAHRSADVLAMRGCGPAPQVHVTHRGAPATLGVGLRAQSERDLDRLAAHLGVGVEDNGEPGGGRIVRTQDPSGLAIDVVHGQTPLQALPLHPPVERNAHGREARQGAVVRHPGGPSQVMRLGHAVVLVPDFAASLAFCTEVLGMRVSDGYTAGDGGPQVFAFLHCGLGERWTDHHTLAIGTPPGGIVRARFDHLAYEVAALDDLMAGHAHLRSRGWTHSWGVGRHVFGSQIFDYWRDPFGLKVEHWTDGDRINEAHRPSFAPLDPATLSQWGPAFDPSFLE